MCEDSGKIVPADRVRPGFEQGLDPDFFGVGRQSTTPSLILICGAEGTCFKTPVIP